MQGEGDADDLGGAVVGRDGLKAKGVAHNERGGVSWKVADVATVAEVHSPALSAMMAYVELPARRRTDSMSLFCFVSTSATQQNNLAQAFRSPDLSAVK